MVISKIPVLITNGSVNMDLNNDTYIISGSTGDVTLTLPQVGGNAILDGVNYYIIREDSPGNTYTVTINASSGDTIAPGTNTSITLGLSERLRLISKAGVWYGYEVLFESPNNALFSSGGNLNSKITYLTSNSQATTPQPGALIIAETNTQLQSLTLVLGSLPTAGTVTVNVLQYPGGNFTSTPTLLGSYTFTTSTNATLSLTSTSPLTQYDAIVLQVDNTASFSGPGTLNATLSYL